MKKTKLSALEGFVAHKVSDERMKIMHHGDVFYGLNKIKNKNDRRRLEAKRHNKFIDLLGNKPVIQSGLSKNPDPVAWIKEYVVFKGVKKARTDIEDILKTYKSIDPVCDAYINTKQAKKNKVFYMNALSYLKRNMVK